MPKNTSIWHNPSINWIVCGFQIYPPKYQSMQRNQILLLTNWKAQFRRKAKAHENSSYTRKRVNRRLCYNQSGTCIQCNYYHYCINYHNRVDLQVKDFLVVRRSRKERKIVGDWLERVFIVVQNAISRHNLSARAMLPFHWPIKLLLNQRFQMEWPSGLRLQIARDKLNNHSIL